MKFEKLLQPGRIGRLEMENRVIMAPLCTNFANRDGSVSPRLIEHYRERARGGTGLIIVEFCYIDAIASQSRECQLGIHDSTFVPGLGFLADTIKRQGVRAGVQLAHCGRQRFLRRPPLVAPSRIPWEALSDLVPEELRVEEIREIVQAFGRSALRARMAGFELVEIHGAHGYLLTEFLSPETNRRTDLYGGSLAGRMRFLLEVMRAVRRSVGDDFPVSVRLSASEYMPNGVTLEESKVVARALEQEGADVLHISGGNHETRWAQVVPMFLPLAFHAQAAAEIKREVKIPVIASGSITRPELAEEILEEGKADFVSLARPLLADPEFVRRVREGRPQEIRPCIRCNEGCLRRGPSLGRGVSCAVNPALGFEEEYRLRPAPARRRVAVVGGGPAGLEAARVAAGRGHEVTLYERRRKLGGQLQEASVSPFKRDISFLIEYYARQMEKLGVRILFQEADPSELRNGGYEAIVLATGAEPIRLAIPGAERENVCGFLDVLRGRDPGEEVTVIGAGMIGSETALHLAEMGKQVRIVKRRPGPIAEDVEAATRTVLLQRLAARRVEVLTGQRIVEVRDGGIVLADPLGRERVVGTRAVVIAVGLKPDLSLRNELEGAAVPIHLAGDCIQPRKIMDAVYEGFLAGWKI